MYDIYFCVGGWAGGWVWVRAHIFYSVCIVVGEEYDVKKNNWGMSSAGL